MLSLFLILIYYSMFIYSNVFNGVVLEVINISVFVLLFILSIYYNKSNINKGIKSLRNDIKKHYKRIIVYSIITLITYSIVSIILGYFLENVITEETVADSNVIRVVINLLIWAPLTEELIFRCSLKKDIKNNTIFILISPLLFAGVHVLGNGLNLITLISSIPYILIGIYFTLLYIKIDNIIINILMHLLINVIGVVMIISML